MLKVHEHKKGSKWFSLPLAVISRILTPKKGLSNQFVPPQAVSLNQILTYRLKQGY